MTRFSKKILLIEIDNFLLMLNIALTWNLVKFNFKIIEYEYEANTITKFKSRFSEFISKLNKRKQILLSSPVVLFLSRKLL